MTFSALTFLSPWLLMALASLPIIYWLLRAIPPRPQSIEFPPTRILKDIKDVEKTPAKTPWWLLLIRLLAATLIIVALAEPILNPAKSLALKGSGPLAIFIDNGWPSATNWDRRLKKVDRLITNAANQSRPIIVIPTATPKNTIRTKIEGPNEARTTARALKPQPFAPNISDAATALKETLGSSSPPIENGIDIIWITDNIDHDTDTTAALNLLSEISTGATFTLMSDDENKEPLALAAQVTKGGRLSAIVKRADGAPRSGKVTAYTARNENIGSAAFAFKAGETQATSPFDIPLELRNQVARISIDGQRSAGAIALLDARSQWRRVALISSEGAESAQPLLAPLYYLQKALKPFAQIVKTGDANTLTAIESALKNQVGVIVLADIGNLSNAAQTKLEEWVDGGGVLVRFAGPRMEKATDELLPVPLRIGGRTLGGALSWSTPQQLAQFEEASPFAGLKISPEITVSRQVLADPARIPPSAKIWARLFDGTPLVTASRRGDGELILFHVTANSDWSNLPISGLFVDMLKQILTLGNSSGANATQTNAESTTDADTQARGANTPATTDTTALLPIQTLDGFGELTSPPPNAQPIPASEFLKTSASASHPPGYYGATGIPRALNIATEKTILKPLANLPSNSVLIGYGKENDTALKPILLGTALALVFLDILAVLFLQGIGSLFSRPSQTANRTATWILLATAVTLAASSTTLAISSSSAHAQTPSATPPLDRHAQTPSATPPLDRHAQQATNSVTLGYILTGDSTTDTTSRLGLSGLGRVLARRSSVTPGKPIGIDIVKDEISFYPVIYWPILKTSGPLPEHVLAKIDAYMKQGGLIIFDTKDFGQGRPTGAPQFGNNKTPLQRLLGQLDIPRLEPVPPGHVLTKSFYLLREFPGRWAGGQLWVEAGTTSGRNQQGNRETTATDGVTSIMITSNDFAAAWAIDKRGRPIYPTVTTGRRQREMAFRTGINIVMHALTGNYKADQVHIPSLLQRLGQ